MCFHIILGMWREDWGFELSETFRVTPDGRAGDLDELSPRHGRESLKVRKPDDDQQSAALAQRSTLCRRL